MAPKKSPGPGDHKTREQETREEIALSDEEIASLCQERYCPDCEQLKEKHNEMLRAVADAENFKKRLAREKEEFRKYANEAVIEDMLPVLDNLELALLHGGGDPACKNLMTGVEMTLKLFLDALGRHGLEPVGAEEEEFDPEWHEALGEEQRDDFDPGRICQLMQKGYKLNDRLVRPAKVIVSKKCE